MSKKQTAVEWLIQRLHNRRNGIFDGHPVLSEQQLYEQALQMEREQIEHAHLLGLIHSLEKEATQQATEYYNETYGKEAGHEEHS